MRESSLCRCTSKTRRTTASFANAHSLCTSNAQFDTTAVSQLYSMASQSSEPIKSKGALTKGALSKGAIRGSMKSDLREHSLLGYQSVAPSRTNRTVMSSTRLL